MKTVAVNHELRFSCPDGFYQMDAEERSKLNVIKDGEGESFSNPEQHMLLSIGWARHSGLLTALAGVSGAAKSMEKQISKPMQQYGYRLVTTKDAAIDGEDAKGFRYEYEAQGVQMVGESFICKRNKTMYYLHVYYRKELEEESAAIWEGIFSSMRWIR